MEDYKSHDENTSKSNISINTSLGDPPETLVHKRLSPKHLQQLHVESGISYDVIAETGYRTVNSPNELLDLGFSRNQSQQVPGILIPEFGIDGREITPEFRPR